MREHFSYAKAGVDIDITNAAKTKMAESINSDDPRVLNRFGAFASLLDPAAMSRFFSSSAIRRSAGCNMARLPRGLWAGLNNWSTGGIFFRAHDRLALEEESIICRNYS